MIYELKEERFAYDHRGCLVRHALRLEGENYAVTTFARDSRGRILTETNADGNEIHYAYDTAFAGPTMKELPEGETIWYTYDAAGRCMETEDASGRTSYAYNQTDDIAAVTDPLGNTTHYSYDRSGNLTELCPPEQYAAERPGIRSRYDALDRKTEELTPEGNRYVYRYDSEDQLIRSIHPAAEARGEEDGITYEYDSRSRRIRAHYPDGGEERYFYDGNGNLIRRIPPETYDPQTDDGNGYRYTYDARKRLTSIVDPEGNSEAAYTYDGAGRILTYTAPGPDGTPAETRYTYNHAGSMTSCRKAVAEGADKTIRYRLTVYRYGCDNIGLNQKTLI